MIERRRHPDGTTTYHARYTKPVTDRNLALLDTLGEQPTETQEEAQ